MTTMQLRTADEIVLEARWDGPEEPQTCVVLCHPHPLHGGTMSAPLLVAVTKALAARAVAVLRFNFRGVGASTGGHDYGGAEQNDVAAAVEHAAERFPEVPQAIAGWSFGAATALRWQAAAGSQLPYGGIAPPVLRDRFPDLPGPGDLAPADRTIILGDRDQFSPVPAAERFAAEVGATLRIVRGSDHFFHFREERVASLLAEAIGAGTADA